MSAATRIVRRSVGPSIRVTWPRRYSGTASSRCSSDGRLDPAILDSYWTHGFYVFEGVVGPEELAHGLKPMGILGARIGFLQLVESVGGIGAGACEMHRAAGDETFRPLRPALATIGLRVINQIIQNTPEQHGIGIHPRQLTIQLNILLALLQRQRMIIKTTL